MASEKPVADLIEKGFWTGERGLKALEPGLSRAFARVESALSPQGFAADGPAAERHGSVEVHYLAAAGSRSLSKVIIASLTPEAEDGVWVSFIAAMIDDERSRFVRGRERRLHAPPGAVRSGDATWLDSVESRVIELCADNATWDDLAERLASREGASADRDGERLREAGQRPLHPSPLTAW